MASFLIPLSGIAENFTISLRNQPYNFQIRYCDAEAGGWFLNLLTGNDVPLAMGLPMVTGLDLLQQYAYLNVGGELWVYSADPAEPEPTFDNLGTAVKLYFKEATG